MIPAGKRYAYQKNNSGYHGANFFVIVHRLSFRDTRYTFDHTNDALTNNNEREQMQSFNEMGVLEANDTPYHRNEKYHDPFRDTDNDPVVFINSLDSLVLRSGF